MRFFIASLALVLLLSDRAGAQSCTGLCLQQVSCPSGGTTTLTGTVYSPNGVDPLPNVTVYIPNAPVAAFTAGVSCAMPGQPPSGSPLVGTSTAADGTFTLTNVPVGANIPLVAQAGRWRRQVVVPATAACAATALDKGLVRMPRNQKEGDIPKIGIVTGAADSVECVLRKVGVDDAEFTNPSGSGRIHLYSASDAPGARIDTSTPAEPALMGDPVRLMSYDALMLPCEGRAFNKPAAELANLVSFADKGGRIYSSHYGYEWMAQNPPFNEVVTWNNTPGVNLNSGTATVNTSFGDGATLADWLQIVGASVTLGQIGINTIRHDFDSVNPPTQSWLTLNDAPYTGAVMQFTFDTPVHPTAGYCGRVLFNEYHVENSSAQVSQGRAFPTECTSGTTSPQEKLLEYSLFNLTNDGSAATLLPAAADFGPNPVGFTTPQKTFSWTNNSVFSSAITSVTATGDYLITANNCPPTITAGSSCMISVAFRPSALGERDGTLTVTAEGKKAASALTGQGVADLSISPTSLDFGKVDVGATASLTATVTNNAPGPIVLQPITASGDFTATSNCATLGASASCTVTVTFKPTATGARTGILTVMPAAAAYVGATLALTGTGVDFGLALNPASGSVIAGFGTTTSLTVSPIAGFSAPVMLSCASNAPGTTCTLAVSPVTPTAAITEAVTLTSTSQYSVIGYGGLGLTGLTALFGFGSVGLLWGLRRKSAPHAALSRSSLLRTSLLLACLVGVASWTTGCSGKSPAQNIGYTPAGSYTVTVTGTDGVLTHTVPYALTVTAR